MSGASVAPEVVAYVEARIAELKGASRCYASVAIAVVGFVLGLLGAASIVSPTWGALGAGTAASGSVMISHFCGTAKTVSSSAP
jgi:hypothetical protein